MSGLEAITCIRLNIKAVNTDLVSSFFIPLTIAVKIMLDCASNISGSWKRKIIKTNTLNKRQGKNFSGVDHPVFLQLIFHARTILIIRTCLGQLFFFIPDPFALSPRKSP